MQTRMRHGVLLFVAALSCVSLTATSAAAPADPEDGVKSPSDDVVAALDKSQEPYDAWGLSVHLARFANESFGGLYGDGEGGIVIAHVEGAREAVERSKAGFDDTLETDVRPPVRYETVKYALAVLENEKVQVLSAQNELTDQGSQVALVDVDESSNELVVGLVDNNSDSQARVDAALDISAGDGLRFEEKKVVPLSTRWDDFSPWNAGDGITNSANGAGCSTGFGVHQQQTGVDYLVTAAHCSGIAGQTNGFRNHGPQGDFVGFSTNPVFGPGNYDTQLIRAESSTITWTAVDSRSFIAAGYTPVYYDDNQVIQEGAYSNYGTGWPSGLMRVVGTDFCQAFGPYNVWGTVTICNIWLSAPQAPNCATVGGDSGGPIVSYSGYGPLAVGQMVGGTCSGAYFHAVREMLGSNPYGLSPRLSINTVDQPG